MMTPFEAHILIQKNDPSSFQTLEGSLKSKRLNPNITFKRESLLATAIKRNVPNLLKLLLEHGAGPDLKSYENGRYEPALITAVRMKSLTSVRILAEHGASLYKTNFYGTDAIFQAVHENAFDILDYLLQAYEPPKRSWEYYHSRQQPNYASSSPALCSPSSSIVLERATTSKETSPLHMKEQGSSPRTDGNKANDGNGNCDHDDDHVLCPFYYALNQAIAFPSKRESLIQLLQSYYRCKCLQEIASCWGNSIGPQLSLPPRNNTVARSKPKPKPKPYPGSSPPNHYPHGGSSLSSEKVAVRECLAWLGGMRSSSNILKKSGAIAENPETHNNNLLHSSINTSGSSSATTRTSPRPPASLDNGKYIKLENGDGDEGGSGNELSLLYPYKIYKIEGKCHTIKENESSSSSSSPSTSSTPGEGRGRGPSSSYLVLMGPLKLSCITREVIRDQIMLCSNLVPNGNSSSSSSIPISSESSILSLSATGPQPSPLSHSDSKSLPPPPATVASGANNNLKVGKVKPFPSPSTVIRQQPQLRMRGDGRRRNFRKSLDTLMIPSALKDFISYKEPNPRNEEQRNSIHLIKRDLANNINYFAIYI